MIDIRIPSPGESITEVDLASWLVEDGQQVEKDQRLAEIESDKASLELLAEAAGKVSLKIAEGETVAVGTVACTIDPDSKGTQASKKIESSQETIKNKEREEAIQEDKTEENQEVDSEYDKVKLSPVARQMLQVHDLSIDDVINGLHRLTKQDVEAVLNLPDVNKQELVSPEKETDSREKMSALRRKISERLVSVKNETAMLTTFNEVDMSALMTLRKAHQQAFIDKYGFKIGIISFFVKAVCLALKRFPVLNAMIDNSDIVYHHQAHVGIAMQSPKGLMVPIVRHADRLSLPEIEQTIKTLADKAGQNRIALDDLSGGTFTITNGGTFGSLLSTPILNPPQSGILGMHNIVDRPVALDGQVVIRPMMYLALSYDHRLVDGKSSVSFLLAVKDYIEHPYKMLLDL